MPVNDMGDLLGVCETYVDGHRRLLDRLSAGGDPAALVTVMHAQLDQLASAVRLAGPRAPSPMGHDPGA
jgi:hypothetical protein